MSTDRKRFLIYVVIGISVVTSVKLVKDIIRLWHVDDRLIEARKKLLLAQKEQLELQKEIKKAESGDLVEKQIRNTLKMARLNEEVVIIPEEITQRLKSFKVEKKEEEKSLSNFKKWQQVFGIIN